MSLVSCVKPPSQAWRRIAEEEEDNTSAAEAKRISGAYKERFEEQGERWCCNTGSELVNLNVTTV